MNIPSMPHYAPQWIEEWCCENGWTDSFVDCSRYWGFPPNSVMPVPIPAAVLRAIKAQKGLCWQEKISCTLAIGATAVAIAWSWWSASPMPLVLAFGFCAVTVVQLEDELLEDW
jgi:hypothetical protein